MVELVRARHIPTWVCLVAVHVFVACGASAPELWEAGRFPEACREMDYAQKPQFLDALYAQSRLRVDVHAYTASELEAMLPVVPPLLVDDSHVLLGIRAEVAHEVRGSLEIAVAPRLGGRQFRLEPFCAPVQTALDPSREPEVAPEGWMTRLGRTMRVVGGSAAASVADVVWAATGGAVDASPGSLEEGVVSLRTLGEAVANAEADDGSSPANAADEEARQRALAERSAQVLNEMLSGSHCRIEGTTACTHFALYHTDLPTMTGADLQIIVAYHEGELPDRCDANDAWVAALEGRGEDRVDAINALFASGPVTFPDRQYTRGDP